MSITGKTISELPLLTGYSENITIPVQLNNETYQSPLPTLQSSRVWSALLTQTGSITYTGDNDTPYGGFIFNEIYTIDSYSAGDDFSNVAEVLQGVINTTGCIFRATGSTTSEYIIPNTWNNSTLTSDGNMIVNVLENTLGFEVFVDYPAFSVDGIIAFFPDVPMLTHKTKITAQPTIPFGFTPIVPTLLTSVDSTLLCGIMYVIDQSIGLVGDSLNNTPVEIKVLN
jgi:hypothetical protein